MAEVQKWMPADGVGAGARVLITEVDPICALQACMEGYLDIITVEHKEKIQKMPSNAILGLRASMWKTSSCRWIASSSQMGTE